jgi:primosomal protein N' (replication factor Y)
MTTAAIGTRVSVPFGHQKALVGIIVDIQANDGTQPHKLRPIHAILDNDIPALDKDILALCQWCAQYYHYPLGEVCHLALPTLLRKTNDLPTQKEKHAWQLTSTGQACDEQSFGRAKKQYQAWQYIREQGQLSPEMAKTASISRAILNALIDKDIIETCTLDTNMTAPTGHLSHPPLPLNQEQAQALAHITYDTFTAYLLDGVTGSGKTEVYLQAIAQVINDGKQALVLVPEIGLTPQTVQRFQQRFNVPVATLHSGISDKQRYHLWQSAKAGQTPIIIGTRSAVFTPLPNLGLIIVDEEHDLSYKQQDGVRYSARDAAIVRAQKKNIPIILGSATPSLETLHNALTQRFTHLHLTVRATSAAMPSIRCVDSKEASIDPSILQAIQTTLDKQQQALIFINRRGYAPTLICQDCGWISQCNNCDSRMTLHRPKYGPARLHCHHCDTKAAVNQQCPQCHSERLQPLGQGTQRSEEELSHLFNNTPILRIDRDSISRKGELEAALNTINSGQACILVGTQMLAKGHHFANVSLAVILGLDNSFFSSDFRGAERMGQLLTQVAGRAGREQHTGTVLLQTQFSQHPLLQTLITEGYSSLAQHLLAERKLSDMPPYEYMALIRCHAQQASIASQFLQHARQLAESISASHPQLQYIGPFPATIEKRNNRYYYYLQIKAHKRSELHALLTPLCHTLEQQRAPKGLHWLIDVDPQEL